MESVKLVKVKLSLTEKELKTLMARAEKLGCTPEYALRLLLKDGEFVHQKIASGSRALFLDRRGRYSEWMIK